MKIGLTGGIGCGKSTALLAFQKYNFTTFSADAIGHSILESTHARTFVKENFGAVCFEKNAINRAILAKIVFADTPARARLEAFIHPLIEAEWRENACRHADCVVEIPLLFEKNYEREFDKTICVACSENLCLERLEARGIARENALSRIAAQLPLEEKIRRADFCVFNDGDEAFLEKQISIITKQ